MSRHRMVRNMTEDDYYDDYDDYYEEDDAYDQHPYAPPSGSSSSSRTNNTTAESTTTTTTNTTPASFDSQNIAVAGKAATTASVGVTKPPPGWGKPSASVAASASAPSAAAAAAAAAASTSMGVMKPPPGWGKPTTPISTAASAIPSTISGGGGGVSKPPPGWGKPSEVTSTTTITVPSKTTNPKRQTASAPSKSNTTTTATTSSSSHWKPRPLPASIQNTTDGISKMKSQLSMVVLGHVDAGKSTLMGQLLVQTGQVSQRDAKKTGQLSWLLDENESERARGVTMEIATKGLSTPHHDITVLDAPGHADFIPIMITGAANADAAVLVVAAVTGEFEAGFDGGGQTKEHVLLAKGLGVSQVLVAVNKLDVEGWNQARYESIQEQVKAYLLQQQFKAPRIRFVPLSGLTGENVDKRTDPNLSAWYKGPTLLEAMDAFKPANRNFEKPFRFVVTDMYAEGKGVVARGRVIQGWIQMGAKVVVLPIGDISTLSKLEHIQPPSTDTPERLAFAMAGDTVEVVLAGIDAMRISVGNIVADPHARPPVQRRARAKLLLMDNLTVPLIRGAQVLFHMHSLDVPAVLNKLIALTKRDGSIQRQRPRALTSGSSAIVELTLSDKIVMEEFQECRALGRFVLRRGGDTIAVGVIDKLL